jgi:hypothetical protein
VNKSPLSRRPRTILGNPKRTEKINLAKGISNQATYRVQDKQPNKIAGKVQGSVTSYRVGVGNYDKLQFFEIFIDSGFLALLITCISFSPETFNILLSSFVPLNEGSVNPKSRKDLYKNKE